MATRRSLSWSSALRDIRADRAPAATAEFKAARRAAELAAMRARRETIAANEARLAEVRS